jgi:pimeloyl-ACP methyl ester carboxylesterase
MAASGEPDGLFPPQVPMKELEVLKLLLGISLLTALPAWTGCSGPIQGPFMTNDRMDKGLAIILPGIEGRSFLNERLRDGLVAAGCSYSEPIWRWGNQIPLIGMAQNQTDVLGNRRIARRLANWIAQYQDQHPGRPVYLVGHSGGAGIAVFAAEALGKLSGKHKISGLVLLSPSVSASYDLTKALKVCELGIVNFYNESDVALLGLGTTFMGNVDGWHGASAGRVGFRQPDAKDSKEKKGLYQRVYQVRLTSGMAGLITAHSADTQIVFVRKYVAPWVLTVPWPPPQPVEEEPSTRP